jgi:hypothetical protein
MSRYMGKEDLIRYLYTLCEPTVPVYSAFRTVAIEEKK